MNFTNASTSSFVGCLGKIGRKFAVVADLSWDSFRVFEDAATSLVYLKSTRDIQTLVLPMITAVCSLLSSFQLLLPLLLLRAS